MFPYPISILHTRQKSVCSFIRLYYLSLYSLIVWDIIKASAGCVTLLDYRTIVTNTQPLLRLSSMMLLMMMMFSDSVSAGVTIRKQYFIPINVQKVLSYPKTEF